MNRHETKVIIVTESCAGAKWYAVLQGSSYHVQSALKKLLVDHYRRLDSNWYHLK